MKGSGGGGEVKRSRILAKRQRKLVTREEGGLSTVGEIGS